MFKFEVDGARLQSKDLEFFIRDIPSKDRYILDDENVILVVVNEDDQENFKYAMVHYRKENEKLVEINRWNLSTYSNYFGVGPSAVMIQDFNLFLVQGGHGVYANNHNCPCAIYNYKQGKFIVEKGQWDCIGTTNWVSGIDKFVPDVNYLEKYNGFLAYFSLESHFEEGDVISCENPVTRETMYHNFGYVDGLYFAILNIDGTIRGNKLFKGSDFSRIEEIIDLDNYLSLEDFKDKRIAFLEQKKGVEKDKYYRELQKTGKAFISNYLDDEVLKVLSMGKV